MAGSSRSPRERNAQLYDALVQLRATPGNPDVQERWMLAAQDLANAVLGTQFASMRETPDSEDLLQAALLKFHQIGPKLAAMTERFAPDALFRILYSVAKFSMFQELGKLRRTYRNGDPITHVQVPSEKDPAHPIHHEVEQVAERESTQRFVNDRLPEELVRFVDAANIYSDTPWGPPVRFCALQRLRGRFVSSSFVKTMWAPPDPDLVVSYGDFVVRAALAKASGQMSAMVPR